MDIPSTIKWVYSTGFPTLGDHEIHLWRVNLEPTSHETQAMSQLLAPDELVRADRFAFARDRKRFIAGRGQLRRLLGAYLGQAPAELCFLYGEHGKPRLRGDETLQFNVSHSADLSLMAVTRGGEVGVDVEQLRFDFCPLEIADRYFSPRENHVLRAFSGPANWTLFFAYWTCKEAYVKALGGGLSIPLQRFAVDLTDGTITQMDRNNDPTGVSPICVRRIAPLPGYTAALAFDQPERTVRYFCSGTWLVTSGGGCAANSRPQVASCTPTVVKANLL